MRLFDEDFTNDLRSWLSREDCFLIGVSGGRDSMVLLHFLHSLGFRDLMVCHVNHQLRGAESDEDENFVQKEATKFGYPFFSHRENVRLSAKENRLSLETAAREVRHHFFSKIAAENSCPHLLLAHHADDQIETVIMNFFRGTGLKGLGGMRRESIFEFSGGIPLAILRPFLEIYRSDIDVYVEKNEIAYREDETNSELFALRNRLRHRLIPEINEVFERDVRASVLRLAEIARLDSEEADGETEKNYQAAFVEESGGALTVPIMRAFSESKRRRVILHWLRGAGISDCGHYEVKKISAMVLRDSAPAKINLPGNCFARRRAGLLFLERGLQKG